MSKTIKLADRSLSANNKGYVILDNSKSFAGQVTQANTVYEIRDDFDLGKSILNEGDPSLWTVEIPSGCTLKFAGGKLQNGVIEGSDTCITGDTTYNIFDNCVVKGLCVDAFDLRWFGGVSDESVDSSTALDRALNNAVFYHVGTPIKIVGNYYISSGVETQADVLLIGTNYPNMGSGRTGVHLKPSSSIKVGGGITAITLNGYEHPGDSMSGETKMRSANFYIHGIRLVGSGNSLPTFMKINAYGAPSRPCGCDNTQAIGFDKVFHFACPYTKTYGTHTYNFTLGGNCYFYGNNYNIYAEGDGNTQHVQLGGVSVHNGTFEGGGSFVMPFSFGFNEIRNCLLEGSSNIINISANSLASLLIEGNYFEANTGSVSLSMNGGRLSIKNNYHANTTQSWYMSAASIFEIEETNWWNYAYFSSCFFYGYFRNRVRLKNLLTSTGSPATNNFFDGVQKVTTILNYTKKFEKEVYFGFLDSPVWSDTPTKIGTIAMRGFSGPTSANLNVRGNIGDHFLLLFYKTAGTLSLSLGNNAGTVLYNFYPSDGEGFVVIHGTLNIADATRYRLYVRIGNCNISLGRFVIIPIEGENASAYSSSSTYSIGDYTVYGGKIYKCTTSISSAESWNSSHWALTEISKFDDMVLSDFDDVIDNKTVALSVGAVAGIPSTSQSYANFNPKEDEFRFFLRDQDRYIYWKPSRAKWMDEKLDCPIYIKDLTFSPFGNAQLANVTTQIDSLDACPIEAFPDTYYNFICSTPTIRSTYTYINGHKVDVLTPNGTEQANSILFIVSSLNASSGDYVFISLYNSDIVRLSLIDHTNSDSVISDAYLNDSGLKFIKIPIARSMQSMYIRLRAESTEHLDTIVTRPIVRVCTSSELDSILSCEFFEIPSSPTDAPQIGTTAQRESLNLSQTNYGNWDKSKSGIFVFHDITEGKNFIWNGSEWVDGTSTQSYFTVTYNLMNISKSAYSPTLVRNGEDYVGYLNADVQFKLPANITVTMGGTTLMPGMNYEYVQLTGSIEIENVTGDIVITAAGEIAD